MPPPQGSIGVPEQYLDPPYGGANNVSIDHSKQYSRHQQPQGGSSRGPPGMHQQQMQGQQHTLRGHYGGLIHESGVSNSQEVLHGLSMPLLAPVAEQGTPFSAQLPTTSNAAPATSATTI